FPAKQRLEPGAPRTPILADDYLVRIHKDVEDDERGRRFFGQRGDGAWLGEVHAALKVLKATGLAVDPRYDLAVEHRRLPFSIEPLESADDLRKRTGLVESIAADQRRIAARDVREH